MHIHKVTAALLLYVLWCMVCVQPVSAYGLEQGELIVLFKPGESPKDLSDKIIRRRYESGLSSWNGTKLAWHDFTLRLAKKDTPEMKMMRLLQADTQAGVISKTPLFPYEHESENAYIVELNGSHTVDYAVELFNTLPEVLYAEPNLLFGESI